MKKQKKRLLVGILLLAAAVLCGGRIYAVNASAQKAPPSVYYAKGEEAGIGKNIFFLYGDSERMDGYVVTLTDAELLPLDTFLAKYNLHKEDAMPQELQSEKDGTMPVIDYIYEVDVHVENQANPYVGEAGIDLQQWALLATNYTTQCQWELFNVLNPSLQGGTTFSLNLGTSRDFVLPYAVSSETISPESLLQKSPAVILSQYPVRNLLALTA